MLGQALCSEEEEHNSKIPGRPAPPRSGEGCKEAAGVSTAPILVVATNVLGGKQRGLIHLDRAQ